MSSLPSTLLRLTLLCSVVLAGCGASFQHVYEGDVRFEHCYRLDADASVSSQQRLACWSDWSKGHTLGQTLDRVAYARRRQSALQAGESEPAGPALVTGRPSAVASQAMALRASGPAATAPAAPTAAAPVPTVAPAAPSSPAAPVATARTTPAPPSSLAAAAATGATGRTGLVPAAASAEAPPLSAHQQCSHDCGVTFTGCVSKCDGQTCAQRCGAQVRVCLEHCLLDPALSTPGPGPRTGTKARTGAVGSFASNWPGGRAMGPARPAHPRTRARPRSHTMNPVQPKIRTDLVVEPVAARATPREGASFREALGRSATSLVRGAEAAMYKLPGTSVLAGAVRPGVAAPAPGSLAVAPGAAGAVGGAQGAATAAAEGPGAAGGGEAAPVEQALSSSQDMNLYYLELQERMATENRIFTAQSNVLKARHDTVKNAIGNVR